MKIEKVKHSFHGNLRERRGTEMVVIHHSASPDVSAKTIHQWHRARGWAGIGYHYVIRKTGRVETGRPPDTIGAHAGPAANGKSIGICVAGDLDKGPPTREQLDSLVWLVVGHIYPRYGKLTITGHSEHMNTACPGRFFPMDEVRIRIEEEFEVRYKRIEEMPRWMRPHAERLMEAGVLTGKGPGDLDVTEDMVRILIMVERMLGGAK